MENDLTNKIDTIIKHLTHPRDEWMSLIEVCDYTKLSPSTIHRATQKGVLKVSKKTGKNLFRREWIDKFLGE